MSFSIAETYTQTFTVTNARYLSSKVKTDLMRLMRLYGQPTEARILQYETELTELLRYGYLGEVTYGFKRGTNWIEPALRYTAKNLVDGVNDDPGEVPARANVDGASFYSFLVYSDKWDLMDASAKQAFKQALPFQRGEGSEPGIDGHLSADRDYFSGGVGLGRQSVRSIT